MIIVAVTATIKPEVREEAIEAIQKVVETTRTEAGCIVYRFHWAIEDPNLLFVYEEWESDAALDAHLASPHTQEFLQKAGTLMSGEIAMNRYQTV